mmetsp:Transcript_19408/g.77507  ORF Transcript_19408/g.77507 Transcript_19408/m.77507 type:complete len:241 (-) Transcript_19408:2159-2881(-)
MTWISGNFRWRKDCKRELGLWKTQEFVGNGSSGLATTKTEKIGSSNRAFKSLLPTYKKVRCWKKLSLQISGLMMCFVFIGAGVGATVTDRGRDLVVPPTEAARFPQNDRDLDRGPEVHFTIGPTARRSQDSTAPSPVSWPNRSRKAGFPDFAPQQGGKTVRNREDHKNPSSPHLIADRRSGSRHSHCARITPAKAMVDELNKLAKQPGGISDSNQNNHNYNLRLHKSYVLQESILARFAS